MRVRRARSTKQWTSVRPRPRSAARGGDFHEEHAPRRAARPCVRLRPFPHVVRRVVRRRYGGAAPAGHARRLPRRDRCALVRRLGSGQPARPTGRPRAGRGAAAVARAFLEQLGPRLGIQDQASSVASVQPAPNGRDVVRFQQVLDGVPVLGGELVVNLDRNGDALSIGGEALPAAELSVVPGITPATARETALGAVASARAAPCPRCAPAAPRSGSSIRESLAARAPARRRSPGGST